MFDDLKSDNFTLFAMKFYTNPYYDLPEFQEDMKRIRYIKRLFKKYRQRGELKERLILNHLTVIYNIFEARAATRMLVYKMDGYLDCLKPFLLLLSYWDDPAKLGKMGGKTYRDTDIGLDNGIVEALRKV